MYVFFSATNWPFCESQSNLRIGRTFLLLSPKPLDRLWSKYSDLQIWRHLYFRFFFFKMCLFKQQSVTSVTSHGFVQYLNDDILVMIMALRFIFYFEGGGSICTVWPIFGRLLRPWSFQWGLDSSRSRSGMNNHALISYTTARVFISKMVVSKL